MFINHLKFFLIFILLSFLASCSYNDLTDLWPSGNEVEEEIVIREIPEESFDPEDTEEITITEVQDSDDIDEIDIISDERDISGANEENLDNILSLDETDVTNDSVPIPDNGKVDPIFTYVGQRIIEMQDEFNILDADITQGENTFQELI